MATSQSASNASSHEATQASLSKTLSIRFAQDTNEAPLTGMMASPRGVAPPDEATPIRSAASTTARDYQTSGSGTSSTQNVPGKKPAAQQSKSSAARSTEHDSQDTGEPSWYKRVLEKYGAVSLDNKGSVARDHLALERTFLAWLRTSLAFASIGIAITQLFRLNTSLSNHSRAYAAANTLPYSPLLGQSVPLELVPYLRQLTLSSSRDMPKLGPTLLDQYLLIPENGFAQRDGGIRDGLLHETASAQKVRHLGKPLGATFIGISVVVLLVGFHRYFESQYWIIRGKFPASRGSIALIGLIAGALIIASLVIVVVVEPSPLAKS